MLNILYYPDNRLRTVAKKVNNVDYKVQRIVNDMIDIMYMKKGIGLAATQVDIHYRIIIVNIFELYKNCLVFINPEILYKSGKASIKEGCLSIPCQYEFVPRYERVKIKALDYNGKFFNIEANGILSICIQHEMDHLLGKMFIDYLSPLKKQRICKKLQKLNKFKK
ncbi:Peptide deformylase [Candidatus Providencia siddallii]|uniref:Peptide deformylase n=1 Tax=Candidatus Providencia siddallii TaxID=1715285 RepID=A0A0M6W7W6_9GAMM|nr:Peptide deformylase [Candidatus Providencia siddallii]